jgi:hypothetical protein
MRVYAVRRRALKQIRSSALPKRGGMTRASDSVRTRVSAPSSEPVLNAGSYVVGGEDRLERLDVGGGADRALLADSSPHFQVRAKAAHQVAFHG